jgi:hypothetical protein
MKDGRRMNYGFVEVNDNETLEKLIADGPKLLGEIEIKVAFGSIYLMFISY